MCSSLYGQLNSLHQNLLNQGIDKVKLIGVAKSQHEISSSGQDLTTNWINGTNLSPTVSDQQSEGYPVWSNWDAGQRDLFIVDHNGELQFHQNISGGIPSSITDLVESLIENIPEQVQLGDVTLDNNVNVSDVVVLVNFILEIDAYNDLQFQASDMNEDGNLNVQDIVLLVNLILGI